MSSSNTLELLLLQDSQQLGLHRRSQLTNLIEKQGSVIGCFELPLPHPDGAGVCALLVSEEFAFEQRLRDCSAVDGDEGPFVSRATLMDGACDNFFAGAALSPDQHGGIALRDAGDELLQLANLPAFADQVAGGVQLPFQALVFGAQRIESEYVFESDRCDSGD